MAQLLTNEKYGNGSDGVYAPSTGTDAPIDSACTGTNGTTSLSATNGSFTTGQIILIHQSRGTGAGQWELNAISAYEAGTITTKYALSYEYVSGAQVLVIPQYSSGLIDTGVTITAKAWNGTVGGIYAKFSNGTFTIKGTFTATGKGFRGGAAGALGADGLQGEGTAGAGSNSTGANGNGAGGGQDHVGNGTDAAGGGGGGHSASGSGGENGPSSTAGAGGGTAGAAALTTAVFGGGGGSGGNQNNSTDGWQTGGVGGNGGAFIFIMARSIDFTNATAISANGADGAQAIGGAHDGAGGSGGGGAGGSVLIKGATVALGTSKITATGGAGHTFAKNGGDGSTGRIHADYLYSISGSTNPTVDSAVVNGLAESFSGGMI